MKHTLLGLAIALALGAGLGAQAQKTDAGTTVDIKAPDGVTLKGTYYSAGKTAPGILLMHQCNMDRHAWDGLASDLNKAGFNVLTFDFRGFGESGGERMTDFAKLGPVMRQKWPGDVDAAYAWLLAQSGVDKAVMGAGGASCGVTQAADLAERHPEIKALLLMSGRVSPRAKVHIEATPSLALFGTASKDDTAAAAGITEALDASRNSDKVLKIYPGTLHGVPLFDHDRSLQPMVVRWFRAELTKKRTTND
jgi:dienelactone hydrolase